MKLHNECLGQFTKIIKRLAAAMEATSMSIGCEMNSDFITDVVENVSERFNGISLDATLLGRSDHDLPCKVSISYESGFDKFVVVLERRCPNDSVTFGSYTLDVSGDVEEQISDFSEFIVEQTPEILGFLKEGKEIPSDD
jgi:hypothetical protein